MSPPSPSSNGRRTQPERRTETIEALLDATISTIADVGYGRATTAAICARAGVTQGALFHHFDTRIDLILAALQRLTERRIARYVEFAEPTAASAGDPRSLLRLAGQLARDDVALAWTELTVAARTDTDLRGRVEPAVAARWNLIRSVAAGFPGLATMSLQIPGLVALGVELLSPSLAAFRHSAGRRCEAWAQISAWPVWPARRLKSPRPRDANLTCLQCRLL